MHIVPLELSDTDIAMQCRAIENTCLEEIDPQYQPLSPQQWIEAATSDLSWQIHHLVALPDAQSRTVLGFSKLAHNLHRPEDPVWVQVWVTPDARGRGIGSALEAATRSLCPEEWSARQLVGEAELPKDCDVEQHPISQWALNRGWRITEIDHRMHLPWPVDEARLKAQMPPVPAGYHVATYVNGVPTELRESLCSLRGALDAQAPSGDIEFDDAPFTAQEYEDFIAAINQTGADLLETVAVYHNQVVAMTGLSVPRDPRRRMVVRSTIVNPEHRGRRLALLVKCVMHLEALSRGATHPAIVTDTASDNSWMLDINSQLGFQKYCTLIQFLQDR